MAIHVKIRFGQRAILRRSTRRIAVRSFIFSLLVVSVAGVVLFLLTMVTLSSPKVFFSYILLSEPMWTQPMDDVPPPHPESGGADAASPDMPLIEEEVPIVEEVLTVEENPIELMSSDSPFFFLRAGPEVADSHGAGDGDNEGNGAGDGEGNGVGDGDDNGFAPPKNEREEPSEKDERRLGLNDDLQVVLVLDCSGSMDLLLEAVANSMAQMVDVFSRSVLDGAKIRVHLGVVCYGQREDGGTPYKLSDFSMNAKAMRHALKNRRADGDHECCGTAIAFAVDNFEWNRRDRDDVLKVIFIAGNEAFDQGSVDYRAAICKARDSNIIVNTIYCIHPKMRTLGEEEMQWKTAAAVGNGRGLAFRLETQKNISKVSRNLYEATKRLYKCPVIPTGSDGERESRMKEFSSRPHLMRSTKHIYDWISAHRELLDGYCWDATEICRRAGKDFKLYMVGGRFNLPPEFHKMDDVQATAALMAAARDRQLLLHEFERWGGGEENLTFKILRTVREQARSKGIDIKL